MAKKKGKKIMEMTLKMGAFEALDENEMLAVDGGSPLVGRTIMVAGGCVVAGILAPVTCGGSLMAYAGVAATGISMILTGAYDW